MIRVCDAVMGSGKSSAAISYMNGHPGEKFIYITPYLDEARRIKEGCPALSFVEPSGKIPAYGCRKAGHTEALIKEGRNIASTHALFKSYTPSMLRDIQRQGYTLIMDENVDVLETASYDPHDLSILEEGGYIRNRNGVYTRTEREYKGTAMAGVFSLLGVRELMAARDGDSTLFFWMLPKSLICSFKDVFVLTYLFRGQSIYQYLQFYHLPYEVIGVERDAGGGYRFGKAGGYVPGYVSEIKSHVHLEEDGRLNAVGEPRYSLSMNWFRRGGEPVQEVRRDVSNFFRNRHHGTPASKRLWGSYAMCEEKLRGKGYARCFLPFNARATNAYRDRTCAAYLANVFMNAGQKRFYSRYGLDVDENLYALSALVQWVWRTAVRDGGEVDLYLPSKRMRGLLTGWMDSLERGCTG